MTGSEDDPRYPVQAPGWAALDRVLGIVHPGQTPHQYTFESAYEVDSASPLPAISVYAGRGAESDADFWHYVTYGLTELFEKASPRAEVSGFGFELTFRLTRDAACESPPQWPLRLLQGLGRYVLGGHGAFDTGHVIDLGGPLVPPGEEAGGMTTLEGVVAVPDPSVGKIETPHGSVLLLLLFGLARSEIETVGDWSLERKVGLVREVAPLGITRPQREALSEDPRTQAIYRRYALNILVGEV